MNISKKIFIANVAIVLISTITMSAMTLYVIKKEITRQVTVGLISRTKAFRELVAPNGSSFTLDDGKLQSNGVVLDGRNDLTDKMKEIFGARRPSSGATSGLPPPSRKMTGVAPSAPTCRAPPGMP